MTLQADPAVAVSPDPVAAVPPAADAPPPAPSSWIDGLDADHRRVAELKGWKSPGDAVKGYAHLERALGADKLALPAKGADGNRDFAAWDGWAALGRPDKADDYQFANANDPLAAAMRPALHEAGLAQWQVDRISGAFAEHAKGIEANAQKAAADDRAALQREWGSDFDKQLTLANGALKLLFGDDLEAAKRIQLADGKFLLDDGRLSPRPCPHRRTDRRGRRARRRRAGVGDAAHRR